MDRSRTHACGVGTGKAHSKGGKCGGGREKIMKINKA